MASKKTLNLDNMAALRPECLAGLRTARSFVDWQRRREFWKDLDQQRGASRRLRSKDRFPEAGCQVVWNAVLIKFGHFA
jgi:hypothetical protein